MHMVSNKRLYGALLFALFVSGAAGLVNQIAWQRAVKVYLGNSETLSATIVVLVFMLGLGIGAMIAARRAASLRNPFAALAAVELLLCAANVALRSAFGEQMRSYGYQLLRQAANAGIPAPWVFALLCLIVLIVPCILMGMTLPLAAEAAQRQLSLARREIVAHFFFINTVGAVLGTLGCGLLLLPLLGQKATLATAAFGNLCSGLIVYWLLRPLPVIASAPADALPKELPEGAAARRRIPNELVLAFALGALSLSYEILLFRIVALGYTPLPWIFSVVLCGFLLFWSLGVALSERLTDTTVPSLLLTAAAVAIVPFVFAYQRYQAVEFPIWTLGLLYFLPCFGFGILFGTTISRYARRWGRDVGVFTALNTVGSAAGILATTFVLFEFDKEIDAWLIAFGLLLFVPYFYSKVNPAFRHARAFTGLLLMVGALLLGASLLRLGQPTFSAQRVEFYGRDGVVEVAPNNWVYIDGLWHSVLFRDNDLAAKNGENVRRKMLIALLPLLAHDGRSDLSTLNIGMGTGATARILAKSKRVKEVDAYEIVNTVREVLDAYPSETLDFSRPGKVRVFWEDARAGLVRRDKQYDLITQSPLYLKQSGSSLLLSREYFTLLRSHLKPGGTAGIYCNSQGNPAQAAMVRRTVSEVFRYYESFAHGYFIIASDQPIHVDRASIEERLLGDDAIMDDARIVGIDTIVNGFDFPRMNWTSSPYPITDDQPLVEYPALVNWLSGSE